MILALFFRLRRRPRKHISHSANRLDVVAIFFGVAQFPPHLADVHVNAAIEGHELAAEHGIHQPLPRHHSSRLAQQNFQQIEFHRSQIDRLPARDTLRVAGSSSTSPTVNTSGTTSAALAGLVRRRMARIRATNSRGLNGFGR
jgi:hypothetical protein